MSSRKPATPDDPNPSRRPGEHSNHWKGDDVSLKSARYRAHRLYPGPLVCEVDECARKAERHHKDGNTKNNARSNVQFLCRKHHLLADGRMQRLIDGDRRGRKHRPRSPAHRLALSEANKGNVQTSQTRAKISATLRGRTKGPCSQETRDKLSAANRGKEVPLERRARIAAKLTGRKQSEATNVKRSESLKAYWLKRRASNGVS